MRMVTRTVVVLALLAFARTSAPPPPPLRPGDPRLDTHPAVLLLEAQPEFDGYLQALTDGPESNTSVCGKGGFGEEAWAVCVVRSGGVVALVGFGQGGRPSMLTAEMDFGDALYGVRLDTPAGFERPPGEFTLKILSGNQSIGELSGPLG